MEIFPQDKTIKVEAHVEKSIQQQSYLFYARMGDAILQPVYPTMMTPDPPDMCVQSLPAVALPYHVAQAVMQAMWDAGLRPANLEPKEGEILAMHNHLEDMRQLVAQFLDVKLKPIDKPSKT